MQTGLLADRFSRKRALMIGSVWFVVGSVLQTATYSYAQLIVGRLLGGVGIGMLSCRSLSSSSNRACLKGSPSATAPLYISEISPPHVRGALLVWEQVMIVIGVVRLLHLPLIALQSH